MLPRKRKMNSIGIRGLRHAQEYCFRARDVVHFTSASDDMDTPVVGSFPKI